MLRLAGISLTNRTFMTELPPKSPEVTQLLIAWGNGDEAALDRLIPAVYSELRRIAGNFMRRQNPAHTLQASRTRK